MIEQLFSILDYVPSKMQKVISIVLMMQKCCSMNSRGERTIEGSGEWRSAKTRHRPLLPLTILGSITIGHYYHLIDFILLLKGGFFFEIHCIFLSLLSLEE